MSQTAPAAADVVGTVKNDDPRDSHHYRDTWRPAARAASAVMCSATACSDLPAEQQNGNRNFCDCHLSLPRDLATRQQRPEKILAVTKVFVTACFRRHMADSCQPRQKF